MGIDNPPYEGTSDEHSSNLYPAGWVDHLIEKIKRLPGPSWLFYIVLLGIIQLIIYSSRWIEGSAPFGTFGSFFPYGVIGFYSVGGLAAIHYVDQVASRSFDDFLPALASSDFETAKLRYELLTLRARQTWIFTLLGFIFGLAVIFISNFVRTTPLNTFSFTTLTISSCLGFSMTSVLLYHTVHQLRVVSNIHEVAKNIDLFNPAPLYAFSRLSSLTGLIFLLVLWFDLVFNPETLSNLGLITLNFAGLGLLALASFILPLVGIHGKLVHEKRRLQFEVNLRLKNTLAHFYQQVDKAEFSGMDAMNKAIGSLLSTHEFIEKVPTWPWRAQTFAFFVSALLLPLIVFVVQILLSKLLQTN